MTDFETHTGITEGVTQPALGLRGYVIPLSVDWGQPFPRELMLEMEHHLAVLELQAWFFDFHQKWQSDFPHVTHVLIQRDATGSDSVDEVFRIRTTQIKSPHAPSDSEENSEELADFLWERWCDYPRTAAANDMAQNLLPRNVSMTPEDFRQMFEQVLQDGLRAEWRASHLSADLPQEPSPKKPAPRF